MSFKKLHSILIALLLGVSLAYSQESRTEIGVNFRVARSSIDTTFMDNGTSLSRIADFIDAIARDTTTTIMKVYLYGAASPEGSYEINQKLAKGRLASFEKFLRARIDIPEEQISRSDSYIQWDYLKEQVANSDLAAKQRILEILDEEPRLVDYYHPNTHIDHRLVKLKGLDGGRVWQQMYDLFFSRMRGAGVVFVTYRKGLEPVSSPSLTLTSPARASETTRGGHTAYSSAGQTAA